MLTPMRINRADRYFPAALGQFLGKHAPKSIRVLGDISILQKPLFALFSSIRCPGDLILKTYDLARSLRDQGVAVMGGFHSPIEQDVLQILLKGKQPVVVCPARSIFKMIVPREWRGPMAEGRLTVLSFFGEGNERKTEALAEKRNLCVAALADKVIIAHALPGSKTFSLAQQCLAWSKPTLTFSHPSNQALLDLGAKPVDMGTFATKPWPTNPTV